MSPLKKQLSLHVMSVCLCALILTEVHKNITQPGTELESMVTYGLDPLGSVLGIHFWFGLAYIFRHRPLY